MIFLLQALAVLKFLILRAESEVLAKHVALLDPFPSTEPFSKLRQKQAKLKELMGAASLSEEILEVSLSWAGVSTLFPQRGAKGVAGAATHNLVGRFLFNTAW